MKKKLKLELKIFADDLAKKYSNIDREKNYNNEQFFVNEVIILSESTAIIVFNKSSGLKTMCLCWWIACGKGYFQYCFPTDSLILGLQSKKIVEIKESIENYNYMIDEETK